MNTGLPPKDVEPPSESPFLDWLNAFKHEKGGWNGMTQAEEDALLRAWLAGRLYQMHRDVMRERREKGKA